MRGLIVGHVATPWRVATHRPRIARRVYQDGIAAAINGDVDQARAILEEVKTSPQALEWPRPDPARRWPP